MQHPWKQFATDYTDRGSYQTGFNPQSSAPSYMCPPRPSQNLSYPTYNRSPAPFNPQQAPPPQQQHESHPVNGFQQEAMCYPPPPEVQMDHYDQQHQYQYSQQPGYVDGLSGRAKDTREDPDMDEDFPSYKDLKNVFLNKQRQAEQEERRSKTLPRRKSGNPLIQRPPTPPQKPISYSTMPIKQQQQGKPPVSPTPKSMPVNMASPVKPRRVFSQLKQDNVTNHTPTSHSYNHQPQSPMSPKMANMFPGQLVTNQPADAPPSCYQEIPVRHVASGSNSNWQHIKPNRDIVRHRPPLSLHLPSNYQNDADEGPRVVITSNSPQSPQKAVYRGEGSERDDWQSNRRASIAYSTPVILSMSNSDNKPRRRASYAEIMITHNSLPRNFSTGSPGAIQRSVSEISHVNGMERDIEMFPRQRRYNTIGSSRRRFPQQQQTTTYQTTQTASNWNGGESHPGQEQGFARVNLQRPSMYQMLYPSAAPPHDLRQKKMDGWRSGPSYGQQPIRSGPHVYSTNSNSQPGKSAAHLQYNSPMALYSTQNAQQALANDQEAAELLKITGPGGKGPAIVESPTLQAVLREDQIKRQTGEKPSINFYHNHREYGPGYGPLRQYEEIPDTLRQTITSYNQQQDKSLTYPMWSE